MKSVYGVSRFSFESYEKQQQHTKDHPRVFENIWRWHMAFGDRPEPFTFSGICEQCNTLVDFSAKQEPSSPAAAYQHFVHWRHSAKCSKCGLVNLERAVLRLLDEKWREGDSIYHVGHFSAMRARLAQLYENVTSSQYVEGAKPGEVINGAPHEDLTKLTHEKGSFDVVVAMEILEHIPDYRKALREMHRVLKPNGVALLSFPFLAGDNYEHLTRAEMQPNGEIKHFLPEERHGDPANPSKGILSFRSFGWKVLDELREAGFSTATVEYVFAPIHGYMSLSPMFVATR